MTIQNILTYRQHVGLEGEGHYHAYERIIIIIIHEYLFTTILGLIQINIQSKITDLTSDGLLTVSTIKLTKRRQGTTKK
jgi:hypothetical protein